MPTETDPEYGAPTTVSPFAAQIVPLVSSPGVDAIAPPTEYPDQAESGFDNVEWTSWDAENDTDV